MSIRARDAKERDKNGIVTSMNEGTCETQRRKESQKRQKLLRPAHRVKIHEMSIIRLGVVKENISGNFVKGSMASPVWLILKSGIRSCVKATLEMV